MLAIHFASVDNTTFYKPEVLMSNVSQFFVYFVCFSLMREIFTSAV